MALAWLLAQLAQGFIGWGRALRIFGLAELVRADTLDRTRPSFVMEPPSAPAPSPAPPPDPVDLAPPVPEVRSRLPPPEGSGT
jgi:hypothetical protein